MLSFGWSEIALSIIVVIIVVGPKEIPNLLLSGGPGVGKTTVARALCEQLGTDYLIINGSEESGIDVLRSKIKSFASTVSLTEHSNHKVVIIDEADYMNAESVQPLSLIHI